MSRKINDLSGRVFARLTVVSFGGISKYGRATWTCKCECGGMITTRSADLLLGKTKSCGCLNIDKIKERFTTHGESKNRKHSREYTAWSNMMTRCYSENSKDYKDYGARGINVCDRWLDSFQFFLDDMGRSPGRGYSLDRENNDNGYSKENCRWATHIIQANNKRKSKKLVFKTSATCRMR